MNTPTLRQLAPGDYFFDDLQHGDWFRTGHIVVTESHIIAFAGLSGDFFDVHMDDQFAREQGFPARIAHGLLGLALTDGLKNRASVRVMAIASLGWTWRFVGPILANDRIGATVAVAEARISSKGQPLLTLEVELVQQDGKIVQRGETTLLTRRRPADQI